MHFQQGFSLIELLVVVTIIAILSAGALPAYNRYIIKAHVIELLTIADNYKVKLIENDINAAISKNSVYNTATNIIQQITTQTLHQQSIQHRIEVTAKMKTSKQHGIGLPQLDGVGPLVVQLRGINIGEIISWTCHVAAVYHDYVPNSCKNTFEE